MTRAPIPLALLAATTLALVALPASGAPLPAVATDCATEEGSCAGVGVVELAAYRSCEPGAPACSAFDHGYLVARACLPASGTLAMTWLFVVSEDRTFFKVRNAQATGDPACPYEASLLAPLGGEELSASRDCVFAQASAHAGNVPAGAATVARCWDW